MNVIRTLLVASKSSRRLLCCFFKNIPVVGAGVGVVVVAGDAEGAILGEDGVYVIRSMPSTFTQLATTTKIR